MRQCKKAHSILTYALFLVLVAGPLSTALRAQDQTIQISVIGGAEIRCFPDSVVNILITPNPNHTFTQIALDWGDGSPILIINPGGSLMRSHQYPIAQFLDDCAYGAGCPSAIYNGFCFQISVLAQYAGAPAENVQKILTFQVEPRPAIAPASAILCAGNTVTLENRTCPSNDNSMQYLWQFHNGDTSTAVNPAVTYLIAGTYSVTLTATNSCGTQSVVNPINVQPLAIARATLDSGSVAPMSVPDTVCLSTGGIARFHAASSEHENSYQWTPVPASGVQAIGPVNRDTVRYRFTMPGTYNIILRVNNACNVFDFDTVQVVVLPLLTLQLSPQPDTCPSLIYTPDPLLPDVVYRVNGVVTPAGDFPLNLVPPGDMPVTYIVSATLSNVCQTLVRRDTFTVFPLVTPTLLSPAADTVICPSGALLPLIGWPALGRWEGNGVVEMGGAYFFDPASLPGNYTLNYVYGTGNCEQTVSLNIVIENILMDVGGPDSLCSGTGDYQILFSPTGGEWSGSPGIIEAQMGIFNTEAAGPGLHVLTYTYDDATTSCRVVRDKEITVVALPVQGLPDSVRVCDIAAEFNLAMLVGYQPSPPNGTSLWSGARIVNPATGIYNPAGLPAGITSDTVTVTYTIPPGCSVTDTLVVHLEEIPVVSAGPDTTFCNSGMATLIGTLSGPSTSWSGPGINTATGVITLSTPPVGTHPYIFTYSPLPVCAVSDTVWVTIVDGGGLSLAASELYVCDTANIVTLPAASLPGAWSGHPGINGSIFDINGLMPGNYPLTFTAPSLPAACRTQPFTLHLVPRPVVAIAGDSTGCRNAACLQFFATGAGAQVYLWNFGDNMTAQEQNPCHPYSITGDLQVTLRGVALHPQTNEVLCSGTAQRTVAIREPPVPVEIVAMQTSLCPPAIVQFQPNQVNAEQSYEWTFGNIGTDMGTNPTPVTFPPGVEDTTYRVHLVTRNLCGEAEAFWDVPVSAPAVADMGIVYSQPCSRDTLIVANRSTGGNFSSQWTLNSPFDSYTFSTFHPPLLFPVTDTLPSILGIQLIVTNQCNSDTAYQEVTVQPTDVRALLSIAAPAVCLGEAAVFTNISTPLAPVRWVTSDDNYYLGDTVRHVFNEAGTNYITIYAYGCGYDSLVWPVEILPPPDLTLLHDPVACVGAPIAFTVGGNAAGQALYYGTGDSTLLNFSNYPFPAPGEYNIVLIGSSIAGCLSTLNSQILVIAPPEAAGIVQDSICAGLPVLFQNLSIGGQTCQWQFGDGETDDQCNISHIYAASGTYLARLISISAAGCRDTASIPVYVRPTPRAGFSFDVSQVCSPTPVAFFNTSQPATSARWDFGDTNSSTALNPTHTYQSGSAFPVTLIAGYEGICFDTLTQIVTIRGTPQFDTLTTDRRCRPEDSWVLEINAQPGTVLDDIIVTAAGIYINDIINRVELTQPGAYTLTVVADNGCEVSLGFFVPMVDAIFIRTIPDTAILQGQIVALNTQTNASDAAITWTPGAQLNDSTALSPIAAPFSTTTYIVEAVRDGCTAADTVTIQVNTEERIFFPNVFTPNDDGINDVYRFFSGPGIEAIRSFQIYTRWGELIFEELDLRPNEPDPRRYWNGLIRENRAMPGVYVFSALVEFVDGRLVVFKGDVTLVRW